MIEPIDGRPTAAVIGGGPGGLMAAEILAAAGVRTTVFEHKRTVGRKLLLAGRSGLNLTNSEPLEAVLGRLGPAADRLEPALRRFGPDDLRRWSEDLGEPTFVGSSGRVFPTALRGTPLLRSWLRRLDELGVVIETRSRWLGWAADHTASADPRRSLVGRHDGTTTEVTSDVTVFALGGASWPRLGSDGGWVDPFRRAGLRVVDMRPSNCGVVVAWTPAVLSRGIPHGCRESSLTVGGVDGRGGRGVFGVFWRGRG